MGINERTGNRGVPDQKFGWQKRWLGLKDKFTGCDHVGQEIKATLTSEVGLECLVDRAVQRQRVAKTIRTSLSFETACDLIELIWWESKIGNLSPDERVRSLGQLLEIYERNHSGIVELLERRGERGKSPLEDIRDRVMSARHTL